MENADILMQALFLRVLHLSLQASPLVLLILAAQHLLKDHISAKMGHALWAVLLVRLLLPWSIPAPFSIYNLAHLAAASERIPDIPFVFDSAVQPATLIATDAATPALGFTDTLWLAAVAIWLIGVLLAFTALFLQVLRFHRRLRDRRVVTEPSILALLDECRAELRVRRPVPIVTAPIVENPALLGLLRPCLLLPQDMLERGSRARLRFVFLHELVHLKRCDILTGWLAHMVLCIHWFNPLMWWAKKRCLADRELACDETVLNCLGTAERSAYGHALLDCLRARGNMGWNPGLAGILEGNTNIERRISMITGFKVQSRRSMFIAMAALMLLSAAGLTGAELQKRDASPASHVQDASGQVRPVPAEAAVTNTQDAKAAAAPDTRFQTEFLQHLDVSAAGTTSGKIGFYEAKRVLAGATAIKDAYGKLQAEVGERQKGLDELSRKVESGKKDYEGQKKSLSDKDRKAWEKKIQALVDEHKSELAKRQADIDAKEKTLLSETMEKMHRTAAQVGGELGCEWVAMLKTRAPVSDTQHCLDITAQVVEALNRNQ